MTKRCAVYDLIVDGSVWYVGMAVNPRERWHVHSSKGFAPDNAEMKVVEWYESVAEARVAEGERIRKLQPAGNTYSKMTPAERRAKRAKDKADREYEESRIFIVKPDGRRFDVTEQWHNRIDGDWSWWPE